MSVPVLGNRVLNDRAVPPFDMFPRGICDLCDTNTKTYSLDIDGNRWRATPSSPEPKSVTPLTLPAKYPAPVSRINQESSVLLMPK